MKAHLLRSEPKKCLFYVWVLILVAWSRVFFESFVRGETQTLSTFYCHSILGCDLCVMNIDSVCSSSAEKSVVNADERFMLIPCTVLATLRAFLWKILPRF